MRDMARHLITGSTGLVGTAVVLEIVDRFPDDELFLVVRPVDGWDTRSRVVGHLVGACRAYGRMDLVETVIDRVRVMEADLMQGALHRVLVFRQQIDMVWHLAGAAPGGRAVGRPDVVSVLHLLNLSDLLRPSRFVCGTSVYALSGHGGRVVPEIAWHPAVAPQDPFVAGKLDTERDVLGKHRFSSVAARLCTVIGHSVTGAAFSARTPGWAAAVKEAVFRLSPTGDGPDKLVVDADPDALVNLLHVDHAARQLVTLAYTSQLERVYHLVPDAPMALAAVADRLQERLGVVPLALVPGTVTRSGMQGAASRVLRAWRPVPGADQVFGRGHAFGATGVRDSVGGGGLSRCIGWVADALGLP